MDELVARKVMGWTGVWLRHYSENHYVGGHFETEEACRAACEIRGGDVQYPMLHWSASEGCTHALAYDFRPSTEIASAWQVAEKIAATKNLVISFPLPGGGSTFDVRGWDVNGGGRFIEHATTAPHAICLAALAVVGVTL